MTAQPALTDAVFAATTLCPQIVRNAIKAKYGEPAQRLERLGEARVLLRRLDAELALAETAVEAEVRQPEETSS